MVKNMYVVRKQSTKKEGVLYFSLVVDFGYRQTQILGFEDLLLSELCGVFPAEFYSAEVNACFPVKFDLSAISQNFKI